MAEEDSRGKAGERMGAASHHGEGSFDDARMERAMGLLLRLGVLMAATVVIAGGAMYLADHAGSRVNYSRFVANPIAVRHPTELAQSDAAAVLDLGILLLIATPIARVAFAVVAFARERDRLYVAISATVLTVLLWGMLRGG